MFDVEPYFKWPDVEPKAWREYKFQIERFPYVENDIKVLHCEHWEETEGYRHGLKLNPDYRSLAYSDHLGMYRVFTIRHEGVLVGNCAMYLCRSTHTQQLIAREDTLYITPEHRKGFLALAFMRYVESTLDWFGVTQIDCTVKMAVNSKLILSRMGYQLTAEQMTKIFHHNIKG